MAVNKFKFNHLCLSIMLVTGSVATVAEAAVTADKHTINNINVLTNSNNSETVNINAPSANGISHNKYSRFDVNKKGLVLNNSKDSSLTSVAGLIAGNRNLNESAPARVILNEVTSSQASKLEGNLEVAGQKAHVIIANPNGITCNGCDFINTSRNTLTTGTPQFTQKGELAGFKVEKGGITITDNGLKDKFSEYTDLIGRYVVLNGAVEAQNLTVVAGRNNLVGLTETGATAQSKLDDATTNVLVDVSRLGGMYANKITVVANNNGVGVRNAGVISAASDLDISSSGDIINNLGLMQAARSITLNSDNKITNQGGTIDTFLLNVKAKELANNKQAALSRNEQGQIEPVDAGFMGGSFTSLAVEKKITNSAKLLGAQYLDISASELENDNGFIASTGTLNIKADSVKNSSSLEFDINNYTENKGIHSLGNIGINADKVVNEGQIYAFNDVNITAKDLDNKFSHIKANNDVNLRVDNMLYMADAAVKAGRDVNLDVGKIDNNYAYNIWWFFPVTETKQGEITAGRNVDYRVQKSLGNHNVIKANNAVTITAEGNFDNKKAITGNTISLKTKDFENYGELNAADWLSADVTNSLSNSGVLKGANNIVLSAPVVTNSGTIESADSLIYSPSFKNSGQLVGDVKLVNTLKPVEEPEDPAEEAQDPTEEAQDPTEEAQDPAEEAQDPTEEAQDPTEEAQDPAGEAQDPTEEPQDPTEEAQDPTEEAQDPAEEAQDTPGNDDIDPQVVNSIK